MRGKESTREEGRERVGDAGSDRLCERLSAKPIGAQRIPICLRT